MLARIRDAREQLEQAEEDEEHSLIEKEKIIMERRATRMKVRCRFNLCTEIYEIDEIVLLFLAKHF